MPNVATWLRPKDEKWFLPIFDQYPDIRIWNALTEPVALEEMNGLLLTGGPDIAPEFLRQEVPDPAILDKNPDPARDAWEFPAIQDAVNREIPLFAICKGMQTVNVALGGTLFLDIPGHNLPEQKDHDIQPLRFDLAASHRFSCVNSTHHQAVDRVAEGWQVEGWASEDGVIEQMRLQNYPFGLCVQYHPERGGIYGSLFNGFFEQVRKTLDR